MSMHNWMRSEPLEVTLARLARFGYKSIEIKGEPDQYDTKDVRSCSTTTGCVLGSGHADPRRAQPVREGRAATGGERAVHEGRA